MEVLDWSRCIICQEDGSEPLKCPLSSPHATSENRSSTYINFLTNVEKFCKIKALPVELPFGEEETVESFVGNSASWHKSCYLKFNNFKLAKAIKKREREQDESGEKDPGLNLKKRRSQELKVQRCFLCDENDEIGLLHQVLTYDADANIRAMVTELNDTQLLGKIIGGDLIATEAKYHHKCLTKLRNRYRSHIRMSNKETEKCTSEKMNESVAFVELTTYIEKAVESGVLLFKLSEIHSLYVNRLEEMGTTKQINKTRLKNSLMQHFPEAQEQFDGHNVCLVFKEGIANMLKDAMKKRNFSEDASILAKAAVIIREDIFSHEGFQFTGQFQSKCQEDSLPSSLKSLISMILNGTNL